MSNAANLIPATWSKPSEEDEAYLKLLPMGYRFKPLDSELIVCFLKRKVNKEPLPPNRIWSINIYEYNPTYITEMIKNESLNDGAVDYWYFFTPRDRKYQNGSRPDRSAGNGYWKATGADKKIMDEGEIVGLKKTLVFYIGKQPKGEKTNWIMHEFVLSNSTPSRKRSSDGDMLLNDYVLCRIYEKLPKKSSSDIQQVEEEAEVEILGLPVETTKTQSQSQMQDSEIIPLPQQFVDQESVIIPPQQSDDQVQFQVDQDHCFDMLQQQTHQTPFNCCNAYAENHVYTGTSSSGELPYFHDENHVFAGTSSSGELPYFHDENYVLAGTSSSGELPYFHDENYAFAGTSSSGELPYFHDENYAFGGLPDFPENTYAGPLSPGSDGNPPPLQKKQRTSDYFDFSAADSYLLDEPDFGIEKFRDSPNSVL